MSSKYIKKYDIPPGFQDLLSEFTKEILRNQPKDIIDFGIEYFKCLQQGLILDYAYKGANIPCDFKPSVPKIPASLKNLKNIMIENVQQGQKELHKPKSPKPKPEDIKRTQKIEEKTEKNISTTKIIIEEEKQIVKPKLKNIMSTSESVSKEQKGSPMRTLTKGKNSVYENCIDFEEKETILQQLKENSEIKKEIEEYITKDFEPNKQINDLIILLQKTIMAYYNTKGTDKEGEYNKLNEEAQSKD